MSLFDPTSWRAALPEEVLDSIQSKNHRRGEVAKRKNRRGKAVLKDLPGLLVFRSLLNPLDVYAYLRARFGEPNGMQSMMIHKLGMVREDSSNMIQWDYALKAGDENLNIIGAGREVHVMAKGNLSDDDWIRFASELKNDFARFGKDKSEIIKSLEKWYVFPNRYKSLADRCADLHEELSRVVEEVSAGVPERPRKFNKKDNKVWGEKRSRLTNSLIATSIQLSVLTPIMFEAFIGLITAVLLKPEVQQNKRLAESFKRAPLDVKIYDLAMRCVGFARPITETNEAMRRYWKVVNERNDLIHGNVDPVRDAVEIVYFSGNMPLFPRGGDAIEEYFTTLIKQYRPADVLANFMLANELIVEILSHMFRPTKDALIDLINDSQPGWDNDRRKLGSLFADYVGSFFLPGTRYDTDIISSDKN